MKTSEKDICGKSHMSKPPLPPRGARARWMLAGDQSLQVHRGDRWAWAPALLWLAALLGFSLSAVHAQNYALDWFTIDCGGGRSTGGVYAVSGTIGQPEAGALSGGNYALIGGFWGVIAAVQTPGAPLVAIEQTRTNSVIVSWPAPATGWELQGNPDLNPTNWVKVATAPQELGGRKQIVVPLVPPPTCKFYRLHKS